MAHHLSNRQYKNPPGSLSQGDFFTVLLAYGTVGQGTLAVLQRLHREGEAAAR